MSDPKEERGFTLAEDPQSDPEPQDSLPSIDFSTFVLSLGASAMLQLGIAPDPAAAGAPPEKNLPFARQTIDTLEMLEEKTRGNLDDDESKLIQSVLYELHMEFVRAQEGK
jgi:hypothetical protein